jgi:hypothetical protein
MYPNKALLMQHADDPALEITRETNDLLTKLSIVNPYSVLVGIYKRPDQTRSGVYLPSRPRDEDIWQGKVGLVLKLGELAFKPDEDRRWPERTPQVGDWVVYNVSDTWQLILGNQHCRILPDTQIRLIVEEPDIVY